MRRPILISAIILPLAVIAAMADGKAFSATDSSELANRAVIAQSNQTQNQVPSIRTQHGDPYPEAAAGHGAHAGKDVKRLETATGDDLDLRYVDWDAVRTASTGKEGKDAVKHSDDEEKGGNGDDEESEDDDEGDEEENGDDEEEEEGGGGWDRPWDAPKLG